MIRRRSTFNHRSALMRCVTCGLFLAAALVLQPTVAGAAEPGVALVAEPPRFPTPVQAAILGLSLTAVTAIGARVAHRSPNTMMYSVLATVALTGVLVAAADRIHGTF